MQEVNVRVAVRVRHAFHDYLSPKSIGLSGKVIELQVANLSLGTTSSAQGEAGRWNKLRPNYFIVESAGSGKG